jgi:hypothetical protein
VPHISASDKEAYSIYNDPTYVPLESLYAMQGEGVSALPHISLAQKAQVAQKAWEAAGGAEDGGGKVSGGDVWNS